MKRPYWLHLSYIGSWLSADFVGLTVCRLVGHRQVSQEQRETTEAFTRLYRHPPGHPARDLICTRCGAKVGTA